MKVLRTERFVRSFVETQPYTWAAPSEVLDSHSATLLADSYPMQALVRTQRAPSEGDKSYSMLTSTILNESDGTCDISQIDGIWRSLYDELVAPSYRRVIGEMLEIDLTDSQLELRLSAYPPSGWLSPHTDRDDKLVSQIYYFNRTWDAAWGGTFNVLEASDAGVPSASIAPLLGMSVLFVRSDSSWHSVSPVHPDTDQVRKTLLVHFTKA